ncbi:MAG: GEVED domain-containing protein, partial [Planctomycetota bacterium]
VIDSERLGLLVTADANAPVGPGAGDAAWDDDADDGIVRIDGLTPGGSCTIVVRASNPSGAFIDRISGWIDFDGDGTWDEAGEAFAPLALPVGSVPVLATLGPLAVPASAASLLRTRLKLSFGTTGAQAAGMGFTFGEVEDYLLPPSAGAGCDTTGGPPPAIWAEDPPRAGLPFTWKAAGLAPGVEAFMGLDVISLLPGGIDASVFAPAAIPPATCFLYVGLGGILAGIGFPDASGDLAVTVPVPSGISGATVFLQDFQVSLPFAISMTPVLPLTVL